MIAAVIAGTSPTEISFGHADYCRQILSGGKGHCMPRQAPRTLVRRKGRKPAD